LRGSSTRFLAWGKENAQFLSLTGVTAVTLLLGGGSFFGLRRDLEKERELRQNDVERERDLRQNDVARERELRRLDVERALAEGRAQVTQSRLVYGKSVLELQRAEEYKEAPWRQSAFKDAKDA